MGQAGRTVVALQLWALECSDTDHCPPPCASHPVGGWWVACVKAGVLTRSPAAAAAAAFVLLRVLQVLAKIGERLGDVQVQVPPPGAAAAAPGAAPRPPAADVPEIDNLFDAAKYGDLEAVEDFIAIGKVGAVGDSMCFLGKK